MRELVFKGPGPVGSGSQALSKYRNNNTWYGSHSALGAGFCLSIEIYMFSCSGTFRLREAFFFFFFFFEYSILFVYVFGDQCALGAGFCQGTEIHSFA